MSWGGSEKNRWFQLDISISMFWASFFLFFFYSSLQKTIRAYWSKCQVETNGSFLNHPISFRDSHYMVLPKTFSYCISTMQSFKSYMLLYINHVCPSQYLVTLNLCGSFQLWRWATKRTSERRIRYLWLLA